MAEGNNPQIVSDAEALRASGKYEEAVEKVKPIIQNVDPNDVLEMSEEKKKAYFFASRIGVSSETSLANASPDASGAYNHLKEAKGLIEKSHINPDPKVRALVSEIKTNFEGKPYDLRTENARDVAKYLIAASLLSGDPNFLNIAVEILNNISEQAKEITAKTLSAFEAKRLDYQANPKKYDELQTAYHEAYDSAYGAQNYERSSTEAAWFFVDSVKGFHLGGAVSGLWDFAKSAWKDKSTATIIVKQIGKAVTENTRRKNWEKTRDPQIDYSEELELKNVIDRI